MASPKNKTYVKYRQYAVDLWNFVKSRRVIPILKGTLAFVICFVLIFLRDFEDLTTVPLAHSNTIIVVIAGLPGKTVGACIQATVLAFLGIGLGTAVFAILAKLAQVPVAQAVVFAIFVYLMSLVKALGQRWFGFSLLAILMAFNGIYTSLLLGGIFSPTYLIEYLKAYLWGGAIVLGVNLLVYPMSSERELRHTLVISLEHVATFAALIGKGYTMTGTEEDKEARDLLAQTVKADFTFLTQKIEETSVEINWSRFSMTDYQLFVDRVRGLQRSLITAHVSMMRLDEDDAEVFRDEVLPATRQSFNRLRKDIDLTIREIGTELGCKPMFIKATQTGYLECVDRERAAVECGRDVSKRAPGDHVKQEGNTLGLNDEEGNMPNHPDLDDVARRLAIEMASETPTRSGFNTPRSPRSRSRSRDRTRVSHPGTPMTPMVMTALDGPTVVNTAQTTALHTPVNPNAPLPAIPESTKRKYGPQRLKQDFDEFELTQREALLEILTSADYDESMGLRLHEPLPSVHELYGGDYLRGDVDEGDVPINALRRRFKSVFPGDTRENESEEERKLKNTIQGETEDNNEDTTDSGRNSSSDSIKASPAVKANRSLVRVYSILFALDHFVDNLQAFHQAIIQPGGLKKRPRRLHMHIYELLKRPHQKGAKGDRETRRAAEKIGIDHANKEDIVFEGNRDDNDPRDERDDRELSIKEALAILENKPYVPEKETILHKIVRFNKWLKSDMSVFAIKTAAAASVFATLIFATKTRDWFFSYGLTSGLLTCIVALAPTLGQSLVTFVLQICGSGFGTLAGLALLEMFKNVGGYHFNPYGITAMLALLSLPMQYLIYEKPVFFVLGLLSLNSCGVLIVYEHVYMNYYGPDRLPPNARSVDTPPLRAGKAMASLSVALAIVLTFQLFILRTPARRTLRRALGHLTYSNLAYNTILQAFVRAVLPADPNHRATRSAVRTVERELIHREMKMQADIIAIGPLMVFAAAEPSFTKPFRGDLDNRIVKANQIMLDRLREARGAIGTAPFDPYILENLVSILSPYRRRSSRVIKTGFYLCAASLMSKSPLPHDSVLISHLMNDFVHDALLLSTRLTRTEEGAAAVKSDSFTRYWFYLLSIGGLPTQLKEIEMACKGLFGELEDDPKLK